MQCAKSGDGISNKKKLTRFGVKGMVDEVGYQRGETPEREISMS
jgi:hypothetical protein